MSSGDLEEGPSIGGLLRLAWERVRERIDAGVRAEGYADLNPAHLALFRYESFDGQRPTQIAERMRITKQSINDLLRHLEDTDYVKLVADPTDSRARLVRLTVRGRQLHAVGRSQARSAHQELLEALGEKRFSSFRQTLVMIISGTLQQAQASQPRRAVAKRTVRAVAPLAVRRRRKQESRANSQRKL
jgi:DNA-binding MarR family transcriptional regulator